MLSIFIQTFVCHIIICFVAPGTPVSHSSTVRVSVFSYLLLYQVILTELLKHHLKIPSLQEELCRNLNRSLTLEVECKFQSFLDSILLCHLSGHLHKVDTCKVDTFMVDTSVRRTPAWQTPLQDGHLHKVDTCKADSCMVDTSVGWTPP